MEYLNKNVEGIWVSVPISNETVKKVLTATYEKNRAIMDKLKKEMADPTEGTDGYSEGERLAVFATMARHYHYAVESYVASKVDDGMITREGVMQGDVPTL